MFKIISMALLFLASFQSDAAVRIDESESCLDYNSGAYIGLGAGGMSSVLRSQPTDPKSFFVENWTNSLDLKHAALSKVSTDRSPFQGIIGELHLGWDNRFDRSHAVTGFMAAVTITNGTGQLNYPTVSISPGLLEGSSNVLAVVSPVQMRSLLGAYGAFRFGLTIGRTLVYTKLGVSYHYFKAKAYAVKETDGLRPPSSAEQNVAMNASKWNVGFLGGIGVDFRLSSSLVLFMSTDITIGSKSKFLFVNPQKQSLLKTSQNTTIRVRPIFFTGIIGIRYFFPKS
jgi:opacity protein-like surface antigen